MSGVIYRRPSLSIQLGGCRSRDSPPPHTAGQGPGPSLSVWLGRCRSWEPPLQDGDPGQGRSSGGYMHVLVGKPPSVETTAPLVSLGP